MVSYPGVGYPRFPHQFDQQKDATLPLTGDEVVLISQGGLPRNATVDEIGAAAASASLTSPPPIGSVAPNTGAFTTLAVTGSVSGAGIVALQASPAPIGSTAPNTGAFTNLAVSGAVSGAGITALLASPGPIGGTAPAAGAFTTLAGSVTATGGSASRSLANRFADEVNVKDFGAKGDGTTDDTGAIQAAMVYAGSAGKPVFVPPGVFLVSSLSSVSGCTGISGIRGGSVLKRISSAPALAYLLTVTHSGFTTSNLIFDGNKANNTLSGVGVLYTGTSKATVTGCEFKNQKGASGLYGWGVRLDSMTDESAGTTSSVSGNYVHDCDGVGILVYGASFRTKISDNRSAVNYAGIQFDPGSGTTTGVQKHGLISGNTCEQNAQFGIGVGNFNNYVSWGTQFLNITGNTCNKNGTYGIGYQADQGFVGNNRCDGNGGAGGLDIYGGMLLNCSKSLASGNYVTNTLGFGIDAGGAISLSVVGNMVSGSRFNSGDGNGLNIGASVGCLVEGNTFIDNTGPLGSEIAVNLYDGGGIYPAFLYPSQDLLIRGNRFTLSSNTSHCVYAGSMAGLYILDNYISGGYEPGYFAVFHTSGLIARNVVAAAPLGFSAVANTNTVISDANDRILLTGSATSISSFLTFSQSNFIGKITGVNIVTPGSGYTNTAGITLSGDGTFAGATPLLSGPSPAPITGAALNPSFPGSGWTTVTATVTGTPGSGATATAQIGAPFVTDNRSFTVTNTSGVSQTLVHGTKIKLAGGANCTFTANSVIRFDVRSGGVFYETSRTIQ